jgi:ADP-heptose:LPS heptosyltransferase
LILEPVNFEITKNGLALPSAVLECGYDFLSQWCNMTVHFVLNHQTDPGRGEEREALNGRASGVVYPTALAPMVAGYMVRKKYVATGLAAIDAACGVFTSVPRHPTQVDLSKIRSILFSQCGHLGDLIMTLPTLHWVRLHRPEVKIGLVVGSWAKPMMSGIAELYDQVYYADHFMLNRSKQSLPEKILQHWSSWKTAATAIRRDGYDAAIECYAFAQNNIPLFRSAGIPVRIGFTCGGFGPLLTHRVRFEHASRPFVDYPRDLLRVLFADSSLDQPLEAYYPPPSAPVSLPPPPYIVIQTGTGNSIREWPEEKWTALIRNLTARGTTVVIAGAGPRETGRAARLAVAAPGIIELCDKLSWDQFATLVAGASHVVCLESSASHLAAAFGIPSTVIMSGTTDHVQFGPANQQARILSAPTPCAPCFRSNGCVHMSCVRNVSAKEATEAVLSKLEQAA